MSRARLVITAVVVEGVSQAEAARRYGLSKGWVSRLLARYRAEGESAFEPRSRRPKTSPTPTTTAPHRSLPHRATPAARYHALPKALPASSRDPDTHARVRHDRVDDAGSVTVRHAGRLHHIGIGRAHARTHVIMLIADLDIRVVDATTGELLRELVLDPHRDYQPRGLRPGPQRQEDTPEPAGSEVSYVLRDDMVGLTGFEPATP